MRGGCFNEAAGIPRGRREPSTARPAAREASMRPRVFPAEDLDIDRSSKDIAQKLQ